MGPGITWYDVLGVLPGASPGQIRAQYNAKTSLLRPELISGQPSPVIVAISRAQEILEQAWHVLGDPGRRARYDAEAGIRRCGGGLVAAESVPSQPGWAPTDAAAIPGSVVSVLGGLTVLTDWLAPQSRLPGRVTVPDIRGLFYSVCSPIAIRVGLRVAAVRLTEHPMPVDGLVVSQSPRPQSRARRGSTLTAQIWHPPAPR
jgi:hypothetical protein